VAFRRHRDPSETSGFFFFFFSFSNATPRHAMHREGACVSMHHRMISRVDLHIYICMYRRAGDADGMLVGWLP